MARLKSSASIQLELAEGELALLGTVLVRLHLIEVRISQAARFYGADSVLSPAVDDLMRSVEIIRQVQQSISLRSPRSER